jgi:hypothetical protein
MARWSKRRKHELFRSALADSLGDKQLRRLGRTRAAMQPRVRGGSIPKATFRRAVTPRRAPEFEQVLEDRDYVDRDSGTQSRT